MDMHHEAGYPYQTNKTAKPFQSNKIKETKTDRKASQKNQPIKTQASIPPNQPHQATK
jgi:hypothetical protein